ncbi:hypothetical protein [Pseudomonas viridiflava]|uniref:hypothetical protein n=1 Tax=Pseudomonas viridiflava TaxID=33069 RepID=UPI001FD35534|nr:hypothetical protein [Pseudomonas viridiflava]
MARSQRHSCLSHRSAFPMAVCPSISVIVLTICSINKPIVALSVMALHIAAAPCPARVNQWHSLDEGFENAKLTRLTVLENNALNKQD